MASFSVRLQARRNIFQSSWDKLILWAQTTPVIGIGLLHLPKVLKLGDKSPLSPYPPSGLGCVNQFSLVLASSSSIANEAYPRSINMNHDRLTLYYRSTISHFLLDLLNPTGTGVRRMAAAAPATPPVPPEPEEGRLWLNKDQGRANGGTWGQRLPIMHMQNKYLQYTNCTMFCWTVVLQFTLCRIWN